MDVNLSFYKDGKEVFRDYNGFVNITSDKYDRREVKLGEIYGKCVKAYLHFYKDYELVKVHYLGYFSLECKEYEYFKVHVGDNDDVCVDMTCDRQGIKL